MNELTSIKNDSDKLIKAFIFSLLIMLAPMVIATRILNNVTDLVPLYAFSYILQSGVLFIILIRMRVMVSKNSLIVTLIYSFILILPFINNLISGNAFNYFDGFNAVIKVVNFFMLYALIKNVHLNEESLMKFMRFLVGLSVVACIFTLIFEWNTILSIKTISNTNAIVVRSFFSNRNQFSAFLVVAIVANFYLSVREKKRTKNYFIFILQIACMLVTFSRSALFSIIMVIAMLLIQSRDRRKKSGVILACLFLALSIFVNTGLVDYISNNYIRLSNFDSGRFELWRYAGDIIKANFLTGVGFYTGVDMAMNSGMGLSQFHNMYADILVDGGIFELGFILCLVYSIHKQCAEKCKEKKYIYIYRASLLAFLIQACTESLSIFALSYSDTLYTLFYISIPLLLTNMNVESDTSSASSDKMSKYLGRSKPLFTMKQKMHG